MVLALVSLLEGCDQSSNKYVNELKNYKQPPDNDVTLSPEYNFASFSGTVWKTKAKTALVDIKLYTGKPVIWFSPPDAFDPTDPNYRPIPHMKIVSEFPVGTHIRIERLMKDNGIGSQYWLIATIENGTNSQNIIYVDPEFLTNNQFIPKGPSSSTNWDVNPDMLEKP